MKARPCGILRADSVPCHAEKYVEYTYLLHVYYFSTDKTVYTMCQNLNGIPSTAAFSQALTREVHQM